MSGSRTAPRVLAPGERRASSRRGLPPRFRHRRLRLSAAVLTLRRARPHISRSTRGLLLQRPRQPQERFHGHRHPAQPSQRPGDDAQRVQQIQVGEEIPVLFVRAISASRATPVRPRAFGETGSDQQNPCLTHVSRQGRSRRSGTRATASATGWRQTARPSSLARSRGQIMTAGMERRNGRSGQSSGET